MKQETGLYFFIGYSLITSFCCLLPYICGYETEPLHSFNGYEFAMQTCIVAMSVTLPIFLEAALDVNLPFAVMLPRCLHLCTLSIPNIIVFFFPASPMLLICCSFMRELLFRASLMSHMFHNTKHFTPLYKRIYCVALVFFSVDVNVRVWFTVTTLVPNMIFRVSAALAVICAIVVFVIVCKIIRSTWIDKGSNFLKGSWMYGHYYSLLMVIGMIGKSVAKFMVIGNDVLDSSSEVMVMYGVFNLCDVGIGVVAAVLPAHIARHDMTLSKHVYEIQQGFMRFLSREVRASLSTIYMGLKVARDVGRLVSNGSELEQMYSDLMAACAVAEHVLDDMLLMNEVEDNNIRCVRKTVRVESLVQHAMEPVAFIAKKNNISLSYQGEEGVVNNSLMHFVDVDEVKMVQVLRNLTSIVVDCTPSGGLVNVLVRTLPCNGATDSQMGLLRIEVHDSGPGMPKSELRRLLSHSKQDHAPIFTRHCSRVDIWMSRVIVELCGGTLGVLHREGPGCTFFVELPICLDDKSSSIYVLESRVKGCDILDSVSSLGQDTEDDCEISLNDACLDRVLIGCSCGDNNAVLLRDTLREHVSDIVDSYSENQMLEEVRDSMNSLEPYDILFIHCEMSPRRSHVLASRLRKMNYAGVIILLSDIHYVDTNERFLASGGDSVLMWPDTGPQLIRQEDIERVLIGKNRTLS